MRTANVTWSFSMRQRMLVVAALVLLASCKEQPTEVAEESSWGTSYAGGLAVRLLSGGGQTATAGQLLAEPIRIQVRARSGEPLSGIVISTPFTCDVIPPRDCPIEGPTNALRTVPYPVITDTDGIAEFRVRAPYVFDDFAEYAGTASYNRLAVMSGRGDTVWIDLRVKVSAVPPVRFEWMRPNALDLFADEAVLTRLRYLDAANNEIHPARFAAPTVVMADTFTSTVAVERGPPTTLPASWAAARLVAPTSSFADWVLLKGKAAGATSLLVDHSSGRASYPIVVLRKPVITALSLPATSPGEAWSVLGFVALRDAAVAIVRGGSSIFAARTYGDSLRIVFGPLPADSRSNVVTSYARGDTIAWSYGSQVFISRDGGRTWSVWPSPPVGFSRLHIGRGGEVIATESSHASRSSTGAWQTDTLGGSFIALESDGTYLYGKFRDVGFRYTLTIDYLYRHPARNDGRDIIRTGFSQLARPLGFAFVGDTLLTAGQQYSLSDPPMPREILGSFGVVLGLPDSVNFHGTALPALGEYPSLTQAGDGSPIVGSGWVRYLRNGGRWELISVSSFDGAGRPEWSTSSLAWTVSSSAVWRVDFPHSNPPSP